nr:hypothetical protein [uncultured Dyadobacter sp.]
MEKTSGTALNACTKGDHAAVEIIRTMRICQKQETPPGSVFVT